MFPTVATITNSAFEVDEWCGTSAFIRDGDRVFRTYFISNRGAGNTGVTWT